MSAVSADKSFRARLKLPDVVTVPDNPVLVPTLVTVPVFVVNAVLLKAFDPKISDERFLF